MKYFFTLLILFFITIQPNFAENSCEIKEVPREHFYVDVQSNVNVRNMPCTSDSEILRVAKKGETLHVVGQLNDFLKVTDEYGVYHWVWMWAVDESFVNLSQDDKQRASEFVDLLEKLLDKQDKKIDTSFIKSIKKLVNSYNISQKEELLFDEIFYIMHEKNVDAVDIREENQDDNSQTIPDENIDDDDWNQQEEPIQENDNQNLDDFKIDKQKAAQYWLDLNNDERESRGLYDYVFDSRLNNSAQNWSEYQKSISTATHRRNSNDAYYDYQKITNWLADEWVVCKNIDKFTHTENVGWGGYTCSDDDCTDELQTAMTRTFDFYMSEEPENGPHFRSVVNDYFTQIGVGISVKQVKQNYYEFYSTIHYCTQVQ